MDFYTAVLRKSGRDWVALCLENGLVGQGDSKELAVTKLKEAIDSFETVRQTEKDIYSAPVSIKDLHEFLTVEAEERSLGPMEMRALYAEESAVAQSEPAYPSAQERRLRVLQRGEG